MRRASIPEIAQFLLCLWLSSQIFAIAAADPLALDGFVGTISCNTQTKGIKYLEAFPLDDVVRPRARIQNEQDQRWTIRYDGEGAYVISCDTRSKGKRVLEAFPGEDLVRPREATATQNQKWTISIDKKTLSPYRYLIKCNTQSGERFLEAYPDDDVVRPKPNGTQDQRWLLLGKVPTTEL